MLFLVKIRIYGKLYTEKTIIGTDFHKSIIIVKIYAKNITCQSVVNAALLSAEASAAEIGALLLLGDASHESATRH